MVDSIPTTRGTHICVVTVDAGTVTTPGLVLGLRPTHHSDRMLLEVLLRRRHGVFVVEDYPVPTPATDPGWIRHQALMVPGPRLREAWTQLALWELLEIHAGLREPHGGDAVLWMSTWGGVPAGAIGVIQGRVGHTPSNGYGLVSVGGRLFRGPTRRGRLLAHTHDPDRTRRVALRDLTATGRTQVLRTWSWSPDAPDAPGVVGMRVATVTVPLWQWPPAPQRRDRAY